MAELPDIRQLPPQDADDLASVRGRRNWRQRLPHLAAAACLVLAGVAGGVAVNARQRADRQHTQAARAERQAAELGALITTPDATSGTRPLAGGGTATVVASARLGGAAVLFHGLPRLSGSRVYGMWFSRGGTMVPAALVAPGRSSGAVLLDGRPGNASGVGITAEPAGGSSAPTGSPPAVLPL